MPRVLVAVIAYALVSLVALAAVSGETPSMKNVRMLVDFSATGETDRWRPVNDGVMGGLSGSRLAAASDTSAVFEGVLSLENNGGFASIRREPTRYDLTGASGIVLDVNGDGRQYQFRIRTNDGFDGVAYRAFFDTEVREWQRIEIPFEAFRATFRGRIIPDAPRLDPDDIRQLGFMIADKRPGEFRLEVRAIGALAAAAP